MRRTAILLALVLSCALLAACGKGGSASTASHSPAAAAFPHTTTTRGSPTRAQALVFAHAGNLTAADVPGFASSPKQHHESAGERRLEQELRTCIGSRTAGGSRGAVAEAGSPDFELHRGILDLTVSSEVSVAQSAAQAAATLAATRSARVRACVSITWAAVEIPAVRRREPACRPPSGIPLRQARPGGRLARHGEAGRAQPARGLLSHIPRLRLRARPGDPVELGASGRSRRPFRRSCSRRS